MCSPRPSCAVNASANDTGVVAVVYRILLGPSIYGFAGCVSPAARVWLLDQPGVRQIVEDPFVSSGALPGPDRRIPFDSRLPPMPPYMREGNGRRSRSDGRSNRRADPVTHEESLPQQPGKVAHVPAPAEQLWYDVYRVPPLSGRRLQKGVQRQRDSPWHLKRISGRDKQADDYFYSSTGAGIDVYILDSGINAKHEEFTGRIQEGANFSPDQPGTDTNDCNGHGTHVSALAAGTTFGAAKDASIIPVRVYDCSSEGPLSQGLDGINWVLQRMLRTGKRSVINMSFGSARNEFLDSAIADLVNTGGITVVAAGNEKENACLESPSGSPAAFAVAASEKSDDFAKDFSNYGQW